MQGPPIKIDRNRIDPCFQQVVVQQLVETLPTTGPGGLGELLRRVTTRTSREKQIQSLTKSFTICVFISGARHVLAFLRTAPTEQFTLHPPGEMCRKKSALDRA